MKNRAVFFDRDDTLIKNVPYLGDPSQVRLMPHARESLDRLQKKGYLLFIVSNQSGVGRGYITRDQVASVNEEMLRQLGSSYFKKIYSAFSAPGDSLDDGRKPNPKLVLEAAAEYDIDLSQSYLIGDRLSDIQCAENAGCQSILLMTGDYHDEKSDASSSAHHVAHTLEEATNWILSEKIDPKKNS
ncbi:MAG: HAD family hydrolase [Verrucomicrobiota bacterium]